MENLWLKNGQVLQDTLSMLFSGLTYGGMKKLGLVYMWYFEIYFMIKTCLNCYQSYTDDCSHGSNWQ